MSAPTIAAASVALSPADAACTDHAGTASTPPKARAALACQTTDGSAVSGVGPGGAGGACGWDAQASPAVHHQLPCMVAHVHADRFERDACEAEHLAQMARLLRLAVAS